MITAAEATARSLLSDPDAPPVTLARSRRVRLRVPKGEEYEIFLSWPEVSPPPGGFPAVYLLDANASFATLSEASRRSEQRTAATGVGPAVLVGIGYPDAGLYDAERRTADFTFGPPAAAADPGTRRTGGGLAFLDTLAWIADRIDTAFPTNPLHRALFGHSLGGFFALHALLRRPALFESVLAISPSVWWDRDELTHRAEALPQRGEDGGSRRRLLVAVGGYEQDMPPWWRDADDATVARRRDRRMVDNARAIAERIALSNGGAVEVRFECLPEEDHASAVAVAFGHGLRLATGPRAANG